MRQPIVEVYRNNIWDPANKIATLHDRYDHAGRLHGLRHHPPGHYEDTHVKAAGNMAGDQEFWLDKVSWKHLPSPDTTPPQTTIDSGPGSASATYDGNPTFSFSSSEPNSSFECKLDSGSWVSLHFAQATPGSPTASVPSPFGRSTGSVTRTPRPRPEGGGYGSAAANLSSLATIWTPWSTPIRLRLQPRSAFIAGTYAIDHTINVRTGDKLLGEVGASTTHGHTYPVEPRPT